MGNTTSSSAKINKSRHNANLGTDQNRYSKRKTVDFIPNNLKHRLLHQNDHKCLLKKYKLGVRSSKIKQSMKLTIFIF